ncbi:MAG: ABC transporter permease [Gemmatimonadales bacterium]|nr:ABC transporter permease [Gemmatimonadales bacterium]
MSLSLGEFRHAARRLMRAPLFTLIAVITLGVGIGANSAIFSVVNGVLLKPLPYEDADRLVQVTHVAPNLGGTGRDLPLSDALYFSYRSENRVFDDLGLMFDGAATITGGSSPERVRSLVVTEGTLSLLRAQPAFGRRFTAEDDAAGAPPTVMLSYGYWQRRFGGDRQILDRNLQIDGVPHQIVGVLPRDFRVLEYDPAIYLPARLDPARAQLMAIRYPALARLRPGVDIAQANADLARVLPLAFERYPGGMPYDRFRQTGFAPAIEPLKQAVVGDVSTILWVLLGTVGLVLLLACANVANLFLVRAESREREVAVRTALGADRGRIIAGFLAESVLLGAVAGGLGLALAYSGLRLLRTIGPQGLPRMSDIGLDLRVLGFTAAISLVAGLLFGLWPALKYGRPDLHRALKEGSRGGGSDRARFRARNGLVVVQVALALVLLIGSGLMVRSVRSLQAVDPGFRGSDQVLTFRLFVPEAEVPDPLRVIEIERQIMAGLAQLPGVSSAGASWAVPMLPLRMDSPISVEGVDVDPNTLQPPRRHNTLAPGFAETLQTPLRAGRTITWDDIDNRSKVVVISENLARAYWPSPADAIGKRISLGLGGDWHEVVGVLADIRSDGVSQDAPATVFWPLSPDRFGGQPVRSMSFLLRTSGDPRGMLRSVEQAVWAASPSLPLADVRTLADLQAISMARAAFAMVMLSIAAVVALILGLVGIYGVISYVVAQRTREIGVRIALGAQPGDVRRMVLGQAALVTATGLGIGLVTAALLTRMMAGLLHGVQAVDPLTYGLTALAIGAVALVASYLPTRRAVAIDPATALRADG